MNEDKYKKLIEDTNKKVRELMSYSKAQPTTVIIIILMMFMILNQCSIIKRLEKNNETIYDIDMTLDYIERNTSK